MPDEQPVLDLTEGPTPLGDWAVAMWGHRDCLRILAKAEFQVRYKRAYLGIVWAVVVPLLQATVLAVVFAQVLGGTGRGFAAFVLSGVLPWAYFSSALAVGSTAIVDGAAITDKVWFPRALLPLVSVLSNLPPLIVSLVVLLGASPLLGADVGPRIILIVPACLLLLAFTSALCLVLSALHVYFRDVRFLVQAALLLWFYVTPLAYPASRLGHFRSLIEWNPMTGVVTMFRLATVGASGPWILPVGVSIGATVVLLVAGVEAQRRYDRLFVDLL